MVIIRKASQDNEWFGVKDIEYFPSGITLKLVEMLLERDKIGKAKYGTSLDRTDLTRNQWLDHMIEEMLDGAGYALCSKDKE